MNTMEEVYFKIVTAERYKKNIEYGKPRRGHEEGTVKAHIRELEQNLFSMNKVYTLFSGKNYYWKLMVLINVHDSFKAESGRNLPILDPNSHASLAKAFLAEYTDDEDMLNIVQYHDIGFAVYRKFKQTGRMDMARLEEGLNKIWDKDLFLLFAIIDTCTVSKGRECLRWLINLVHEKYNTKVDESYILPVQGKLEGGVW